MTTLHPLAELREHILASPEPATVLRIADDYLNTLARMGDTFVLPAEHKQVRPVLEYYMGDLGGWVKYVKGIRDRIGPKDPRWTAVHDFYRVLEVRRVQRGRRDRINAVVSKGIELGYINDDPFEKLKYANKCTQVWAKWRADILDEARRKSPNNRVSEDHRTTLLEDFWDTVDQQIEKGEIPLP